MKHSSKTKYQIIIDSSIGLKIDKSWKVRIRIIMKCDKYILRYLVKKYVVNLKISHNIL